MIIVTLIAMLRICKDIYRHVAYLTYENVGIKTLLVESKTAALWWHTLQYGMKKQSLVYTCYR